MKGQSLHFIGAFIGVILLIGSAQAQVSNTFELKINGRTRVLSQDIDAAYLGTYIQSTGTKRINCNLSLEEGASYLCKIQNGTEDSSQKMPIKWGILVQSGKLVTSDVMEYANGRVVNYIGQVMYYLNPETNEWGELMLYELEGKKFLGSAEKVEVTAER